MNGTTSFILWYLLTKLSSDLESELTTDGERVIWNHTHSYIT